MVKLVIYADPELIDQWKDTKASTTHFVMSVLPR